MITLVFTNLSEAVKNVIQEKLVETLKKDTIKKIFHKKKNIT